MTGAGFVVELCTARWVKKRPPSGGGLFMSLKPTLRCMTVERLLVPVVFGFEWTILGDTQVIGLRIRQFVQFHADLGQV